MWVGEREQKCRLGIRSRLPRAVGRPRLPLCFQERGLTERDGRGLQGRTVTPTGVVSGSRVHRD